MDATHLQFLNCRSLHSIQKHICSSEWTANDVLIYLHPVLANLLLFLFKSGNEVEVLSHFQGTGVCTRQAHNRLGGRRGHETKLAVSEFPPSRPQERPSLQQTSVASETATRCINIHPHNLDIIGPYISTAIMLLYGECLTFTLGHLNARLVDCCVRFITFPAGRFIAVKESALNTQQKEILKWVIWRRCSKPTWAQT